MDGNFFAKYETTADLYYQCNSGTRAHTHKKKYPNASSFP